MDVLSEILRIVRLSGAVHFRGEFSEPWAFVTSPPHMLAARLGVPAGSVTPFHVIIDGGCWVATGKLPPLRIESGDVIIIPRGDQHVMASDLGTAPVPISNIYAQPCTDEITVMRYGGGGATAHFVCGFLSASQQFGPLVSSLPAVLCVRARESGLVLETLSAGGRQAQRIERQPEAEWWQASLRYLIGEACAPGPGNRAVLARLAESLFVQILRWQLRYATEGSSGWLAGCTIRRSVACSACCTPHRNARGRSTSWRSRRRCRAPRWPSASSS
jgi:AraC family transcriptional regulator, alkane utilization regulator